MGYQIKTFIASDGERFSQLYDDAEAGFPAFYPTAFVCRSLRLKKGHATQKVYLEAIKRVYEWEAKNQLNLTARLQKKDFLRSHEIDDLARHLQIARRSRSGDNISTGKGNTYLRYTAEYLRWLADEVITEANAPNIRAAIDLQCKKLLDKISGKVGSVSARTQQTLKKHLSIEAREQLFELWNSPLANLYRSSDKGARMRNVVMLRVLYETGMRRGELLSLKLRHFLESGGGEGARLTIERNHNDEYDNRVNQPVAKTRGRIVPITEDTEQQLMDYISIHRAEVPNVGFSDDDFIFVTHRAGRGQGKPLSISTFDQVLQNLKQALPNLRTIHPHLLRHDWNYRFSKQADIKKLNPEQEKEIRSVLMGWSENSKMALLYNQRHTLERSLEFGRLVARNTDRTRVENEETQRKNIIKGPSRPLRS